LEKSQVVSALKAMRDTSKQRKFQQSVELAINFRGIDFKKAENRIDVNVTFPYSTGKGAAKTALFAKDKSFISLAKGLVSRIIEESEIASIDKKAAAKLAEEFDAFLAEGPVMLTVGKYLGQVLAPKGKMPKPVTPEIPALEQAIRSLKAGVRLSNKKGKFMPVVHAVVGKEAMPDEELAENIFAAYNAVLAKIGGIQNIRSVYIKLSMGPAIKVGEKGEQK